MSIENIKTEVDRRERYYQAVIQIREYYFENLTESPANKKHYDAIVREARKQMYYWQRLLKQFEDMKLKFRPNTGL